MDNEEMITVAEASRRLSMDYRRTYDLAMRGRLGEARKVKGRMLLPVEGVERYRSSSTISALTSLTGAAR